MKRHKWQPTEQHGKNQISHQQPSAHQRGRMLIALLRGLTNGRTNRIHHICTPLRSTVLMLLTLSETEGHSTLPSVLIERTSQWLRQRIINASHYYVFLLWRRKATVLTLFLCIWRRLKANSLQLTYKEKRGKNPLPKPLESIWQLQRPFDILCKGVNILGFTLPGSFLATFSSIFKESINCTSAGSIPGI